MGLDIMAGLLIFADSTFDINTMNHQLSGDTISMAWHGLEAGKEQTELANYSIEALCPLRIKREK